MSLTKTISSSRRATSSGAIASSSSSCCSRSDAGGSRRCSAIARSRRRRSPHISREKRSSTAALGARRLRARDAPHRLRSQLRVAHDPHPRRARGEGLARGVEGADAALVRRCPEDRGRRGARIAGGRGPARDGLRRAQQGEQQSGRSGRRAPRPAARSSATIHTSSSARPASGTRSTSRPAIST